jgi:hypothetical protein
MLSKIIVAWVQGSKELAGTGGPHPPKIVPKDRGQHEGPVPCLKGYITIFKVE